MSSGRRAGTGTGQTQAFGMRRAPEHRVDSSSVGVVDRIFTNELGWNFTRNQVPEYGIDGHAAVVTSEDIITGRMLATQIKGGASRFSRQARDGSGWRFWADSKHLHYWLGYSVPVLVILVRPDDGAAFWQLTSRLAALAWIDPANPGKVDHQDMRPGTIRWLNAGVWEEAPEFVVGHPDDKADLAGLRSAAYAANRVTTGLGAYCGHEALRPVLFADL